MMPRHTDDAEQVEHSLPEIAATCRRMPLTNRRSQTSRSRRRPHRKAEFDLLARRMGLAQLGGQRAKMLLESLPPVQVVMGWLGHASAPLISNFSKLGTKGG
jgi:hypothetical protein